MTIVRAIGVNENRLPSFHDMFIEECNLIGRPIQITGNQMVLAAIIIKREN